LTVLEERPLMGSRFSVWHVTNICMTLQQQDNNGDTTSKAGKMVMRMVLVQGKTAKIILEYRNHPLSRWPLSLSSQLSASLRKHQAGYFASTPSAIIQRVGKGLTGS
jgi:hypothetical protein